MSGRLAVFALIIVSVALNAAAQLFLRAAMRQGFPTLASPLAVVLDVGLRPGILVGLVCYGVSLLTWIYVLSKSDVSYAYPFLGVGFVVVAVASYLVLGEPFTARKIAGTLIIAAGVVVLAGR